VSRLWHAEHVDGGIRIGEPGSSFTRSVVLVNPTERRFFDHAYVLWFGAYGWTRLHIYADSLDDALGGCAEWLATHAPGLIVKPGSPEYQDMLREDSAMADMTYTDSGWIPSWEWGVGLECPTTEELYAYINGN
jgi:hypothetical protein